MARGVEPWSDEHGDVSGDGDGEVASFAGTSAGGPGLVHQGTGVTVPPNADVSAPTTSRDRDHDAVPVPAPFPVSLLQPGSVQPGRPVPPVAGGVGAGEVTPVRPGTLPTPPRVGVGGVAVPTGGPVTAGGAASVQGAASREAGMTPPYGMPGGASSGGDERSDASGLLLATEQGWADPEPAGLPTPGTPAGGATLSGTDGAASDGLAEDRVAVVPDAEASQDTSAWEASDLAMLWAPGGRRPADEEEQELQPGYVLSDDDGWSDEDGAVPEAGIGGEDERPQAEGEFAAAEEPGWNDEDGAAFAVGLGFPQRPASDSASAQPVTGPGLATWRPDRSQAADAEEPPLPATGYSGMLLSTADVPDDEEEDEEAEGTQDDGDETGNSRGIADLLRQGADSWGAVPDRTDRLG
ncbi:hypothetical protein AQJ67_40490 [Streptomyces caeruleatus]|uniref:Uncharacterized protein n=1 Tax=Streptomyces caeruleatus TaxID=661399 RepID=A0A101THS8_9ACTN|nr:hypothetical protein AQJ67_40490 [Streptomyces caeruleatus]